MNAVVCSAQLRKTLPNTVWLLFPQKSWLLHKNKDVSSFVIVLAGGANGFAFPLVSMAAAVVAIRAVVVVVVIIGFFHKLIHPFWKRFSTCQFDSQL